MRTLGSKVILNFFLQCPSFFHCSVVNIVPGKDIWKKKLGCPDGSDISDSPEVKRLQDWQAVLSQPNGASGISANVFPI